MEGCCQLQWSEEYMKATEILFNEYKCGHIEFDPTSDVVVGHYYESPDGRRGLEFDKYFEEKGLLSPRFTDEMSKYAKVVEIPKWKRLCKCCQ